MDLAQRLQHLEHIALDLDGTLYKDGAPFACTRPFLERLRELGIGWSYVTNNCSRSTEEYVALLGEIGIEAETRDVYSSTHATLAYLEREYPGVRHLFVLGTESLARELETHGYTIARDDPDDSPDAVLVGFDTALTYRRLCRTAYWIDAGKPFFATHPDRVCPTDCPTVLVDCGSICAALEHATGCKPIAVLGKPDPLMLRGLMERRGVGASELAMVGDRLYTDIAMANAAGALSVLVLSGEATAAEAREAASPPALVVRDVGELGERLLDARRPQS